MTVTEDEESINIVFETSFASKVKSDVFVTKVFMFAILDSISNRSSAEFHSIPSPARSGYPPVAPVTASIISESTYCVVARSAVFVIPWTFVVAELWFEIARFLFSVSTAIAAFLFTTSAASASTSV